MACSPDGSQSVWKRTLSAASAVAAKTRGQAATAASHAEARIGYLIWGLLRPARVRSTGTVTDGVDCSSAKQTRACPAITDCSQAGRRPPHVLLIGAVSRTLLPGGGNVRSCRRDSGTSGSGARYDPHQGC